MKGGRSTAGLPADAQTLALREVGVWHGGGTPSKARSDFWEGGDIPWSSPKDMGSDTVSSTRDRITAQALTSSATRLVPANSVAVVFRSSILERTLPVGLLTVPMTLNQDVRAVTPYRNIDPRYLAHLLRARAPELLRHSRKRGGSVSSIQTQKLLSYRVPFPSMAVQRDIADELDELGNLTSDLASHLEAEANTRQQQYEHHRELVLHHDIPREEWLTLGELGTFQRGRRFTKNDYAEKGIPAIHYGEIYTHYGTAAESTITNVRSSLRERLRFAGHGDVIIAGVGETVADVGKAVAWLGPTDVAFHDDSFAFSHSLDPRYVSYFLQSRAYKDQKARYVARGKMKRISAANLAKLVMPVPSIEAQRRIATTLDSLAEPMLGLQARLKDEIALRQVQFEQHRALLLSPKDNEDS